MSDKYSELVAELEGLEGTEGAEVLITLAWESHELIKKLGVLQETEGAEVLIALACKLHEKIQALNPGEIDDEVLLRAYIKSHEVIIAYADGSSFNFWEKLDRHQQKLWTILSQYIGYNDAVLFGKYLVYMNKDEENIKVCDISKAFNIPFSEMSFDGIRDSFSNIFGQVAVMVQGAHIYEEFINYILYVSGFDT